ncbi:hypothetical protein HAX54_018925 [Datura stramonium]|uniref:mitogen-activated protein kinase kinase n=1 Tax=Datura stramonium TaxID=4076 RepID=A0ABS8S1H6_DATST|nr:hypothetical protein [Datura stramonium]
MALVRERRQLNLRLPFAGTSERRPRFPLPLPPSSVSTVNSTANTTAAASTTTTTTTTTTTISISELEKIKVLGHGNGGIVYKVRHKRTSAIYALKVVHGDSDPEIRRQILREISILRRTDSPYVIKCQGVIDMPGGDIGDLKPSNLLVNREMEVKIADFGVSKIMCRTLDPCNSYVGTCAYMSPERFDPDTYGVNYNG